MRTSTWLIKAQPIVWPRLLFITWAMSATATFSCTHPEASALSQKKESTKAPGSYTDTVRIGPVSAVFYNPDSLQLEKIKAGNAPRIFESMMHECLYQARHARSVLKEQYPLIKIREVSRARYLLFIYNNGSGDLMDLDSRNDACGLFLFDGVQPPRPVDMMNIATEVAFYFRPAEN